MPRLSAVPSRTDPSLRPTETRVSIASDMDIVKARQEGRRIASDVGFSLTDMVLIATAISELARNIVRYARNGEIAINSLSNSAHSGIEIIARDEGPGIKDVEQVMQVGFSTSAGLGLGLPGVRRLMDEFEIQSKLGRGTTVTTKKWKS
jgi:serine/threonine-protein kinase RsbT